MTPPATPSRATAQRLLARLAARARAEQGFSLIEVIAGALIVVLIAAAVAQGLIGSTKVSAYEQHRSQADLVGQADQERLHGLSAKQLAALSTAQSYTVAFARVTYTVTSQATLLSTSGSTSCATTGTGAAAYYRVVSTVNWSDANGPHQISEDGVVAPPTGGALLVPVVDETANPLSGVSITADAQTAGGDREAGTTDATGCVTFAGLGLDTYTVGASANGFVTPNGATSISDTATVTGSGTSRPTNNPEILGRAGTLTAGFQTTAYQLDNSTTQTTVSGQSVPYMSVSGAGSSLTMSAPRTFGPGGAGATSVTASNLFPFWFAGPPSTYANNYHVWAGSCPGEEPPTGTDDNFTITPGGTITGAVVQEPSAILNVTYQGAPVVPTRVKITFTSGACTDTWLPAIRSTGATSNDGVLQSPGVPFASSATTGPTASASGQTGSLSYCAEYSGYKQSVTGQTATSFTAMSTPPPIAITKQTGAAPC